MALRKSGTTRPWNYSERGLFQKLFPGVGIESKRERKPAAAQLSHGKGAGEEDGERPGFAWAARSMAGALRAQIETMGRHGKGGEHHCKRHNKKRVTTNAHAGKRARVTSMGGLYGAARLHARLLSAYVRVTFSAWPDGLVSWHRCLPHCSMRARSHKQRAP
jgi:hypothetical protein